MYGPAKALFVAAAVLQASANPVFKRQATSSIVSVSIPLPITETPGNLTSAFPSITSSAAIPGPTPPTPFPGGNSTNGTYYVCSFPSSDDATTSSLPLSTGTAVPTTDVLSTTLASLTDNGFAAEATTTSGSLVPTSLASITSPIVTDPPVSLPTASATPFTVVGPSTTVVIECIQVTGGEPHQPHSGTHTGSFTRTVASTATFSSVASDATTTSSAF